MTTANYSQEYISVPRASMERFVKEFEQMKSLYELFDHILAEKDLQEGKTKTFHSVNDFFDDLDH